MPARISMLLSASILLTLGAMHLSLTFWGTGLTPRDPALQASMSTTSPVLTDETTTGRCWTASMPPTAWDNVTYRVYARHRQAANMAQ